MCEPHRADFSAGQHKCKSYAGLFSRKQLHQIVRDCGIDLPNGRVPVYYLCELIRRHYGLTTRASLDELRQGRCSPDNARLVIMQINSMADTLGRSDLRIRGRFGPQPTAQALCAAIASNEIGRELLTGSGSRSLLERYRRDDPEVTRRRDELLSSLTGLDSETLYRNAAEINMDRQAAFRKCDPMNMHCLVDTLARTFTAREYDKLLEYIAIEKEPMPTGEVL